MAKRPPPDPGKFNEAVDAFRELVPMPFDEFEALSAAEQAWAFRVAHVTQASIVQDVFDELDRAILEGTDFREFAKVVGPKLTQAWGAPNAPRVESVFRTNTMRAYNEGRDAIMEKPAVKRARPYLRFDAVGDDRTSDICNGLDGTIKPADDPFWKTRRPPLHHNCFAPGALVETLRGRVPIERVVVGDMVLTHKLRFRPVTRLLRSPSPKRLAEVKLHGGGTIPPVTGNHPTLTDRGWVEVADLKAGDRVAKASKVTAEHVGVPDGHQVNAVREERLHPGRRHALPVACDLNDEVQRGQVEIGEEQVVPQDKGLLEDERKPFSLQPGSKSSLRFRWLHDALTVAGRIFTKQPLSPFRRPADDIWPRQPATLSQLLSRGSRTWVNFLRVARAWGKAFSLEPVLRFAHGRTGLCLASVVPDPLRLDRFATVPQRNTMLREEMADSGRSAVAKELRELPGGSHFVDVKPSEIGTQAIDSTLFTAQAALNGTENTSLHAAQFEAALETVEQVRWFDSDTDAVFNFSVEEDESYVVNGCIVHNCRSILVPLSEDEARVEGITEGDDDLPPPAEGFGKRRESFEVDEERFDPKIWNVLKKKLGEAA